MSVAVSYGDAVCGVGSQRRPRDRPRVDVGDDGTFESMISPRTQAVHTARDVRLWKNRGREAEDDTKKSENLAGLYSLVATCEAHDVDPVAYLQDVMLRVDDCPAARIDDLLPDLLEPPVRVEVDTS